MTARRTFVIIFWSAVKRLRYRRPTAARATCFIELWWTPGEHDQGEDRVHRIGQEADSVSAYYLIAMDTVEDRIVALLDTKRKVLAAVLDGREVKDTDILSELIKEVTK